MIQPNWKESLTRLESLNTKQGVEVTHYLLSRLSDDFQKVRDKANQVASDLFSVDTNFSQVLDSLLESLEKSQHNLHSEMNMCENIRALMSFMSYKPIMAKVSIVMLFEKLIDKIADNVYLLDHKGIKKIFEMMGEYPVILERIAQQLNKDIDHESIIISQYVVNGSLNEKIGRESHFNIILGCIRNLNFSKYSIAKLKEENVSKELKQWHENSLLSWEAFLRIIYSILAFYVESPEKIEELKQNQKIITEIILISFLYSPPFSLWTNLKINNVAYDIIKILEQIQQFPTTSHLILYFLDKICDQYQIKLIDFAKIDNENEKNSNDVNKLVLLTVILGIKEPISNEEFIMELFQNVINLYMSSEVDNKIIGTKIIAHLTKFGTEFNESQTTIIIEKLRHSMNFRETPLLEILVPNSFQFAIQTKANNIKNCLTLLDQIIYEFQYLTLSIHYQIYIKEMKDFINHIGIYLSGHLKKLIPSILVILENNSSNDPFFFQSIEVLEAIILNCWPRMGHHKPSILKSIVPILIKTKDNPLEANKSEKIKQIIILLTKCPSAFNERGAFEGIPFLEELLDNSNG